MEKIFYKGYTIEEDHRNPYNKDPEYMFYPTEQGVQHDADGDSEGWKYTGNCKWTDSMEDAKDQISELVIQQIPFWQVQTSYGRGYGLTKFTWLEDAVKFAARFNGQIIPEIQSV
jgi:hypothetical protein